MKGFLRTRRARLWALAGLIFALIVTFPLSIAARLAGLEQMGVSARSLRGPVWWGGAEELTVGGIRLGTVTVYLDPLHLFVGQAKLGILRANGGSGDVRGAVVTGFGSRGVVNLTADLPLGSMLAPLPVTRASFDDFSARFAGDLCAEASGRVHVQVATLIDGLGLANGLAGEARCDGNALVLPLVSQSGQERLELRIRADGAYEATMRITTSDPVLAAGLAANGFQPSGGDQMLRIAGAL